MKKILFFSLSLVACVCFFSCTTESKTIVSTSSRTIEPQIYPILADLDIKTQKVTGVWNYECESGASYDEELLKSNAVYQALKDIKADILVAPQYHISTKIMGRQYITVTVTGYPAFYKNFRPISEFSDLETIESNSGIVVVVAKDQSNRILGYQVVVPSGRDSRTIDMDLVNYGSNGQASTSAVHAGKQAKQQTESNDNKGGAFSKVFGKGLFNKK